MKNKFFILLFLINYFNLPTNAQCCVEVNWEKITVPKNLVFSAMIDSSMFFKAVKDELLSDINEHIYCYLEFDVLKNGFIEKIKVSSSPSYFKQMEIFAYQILPKLKFESAKSNNRKKKSHYFLTITTYSENKKIDVQIANTYGKYRLEKNYVALSKNDTFKLEDRFIWNDRGYLKL